MEITIERFRNLSIRELEFDPGVNLVLGANGAGKTSALEAVVVLGNLRSFREPNLRRAVHHGEDSFRIVAVVHAEGREHHLQMVFESGPQPRRHLEVNGRPLQVQQYLQLFPVVAISGPDRALVHGGPEERRSLLDRLVFLLQPAHIQDLRDYRRALRQRNSALGVGASDNELAAWEAQLAGSAARVVTARRAGARILAENFESVYRSLAREHAPPVTVAYRGDAWCEAENDVEKVEESYHRRYNETRTRDRQMGLQ